MSNRKQPSQAVRFVSHVLVGTVGALFVARMVKGKSAPLIGFLAVAALHEMFDAPVAGVITDLAP